MLYIIALTLAFIFGWIMRGEREQWKIDDTKPLDLRLPEQDLFGPAQQQPDDLSDIPVFYPYGGREC